jgi:hypothetical protein
MDEIQAHARLVDSDSFFAAGGLSTTLPRAEIERVIDEGEYPARLDLRLRRLAEEGDEEALVAISWDEQELGSLLRATSGDEVTLLFDGRELEQALAGVEVEAHGLKERTAVLAIAVAAAGGSAGGAFAHPQLDGSGSATGGGGADVVAVAPGSSYQARPGQVVVTPQQGERAPAASTGPAAATGGEADVVAVAPGSGYRVLPGQDVVTPTVGTRTEAGRVGRPAPGEDADVVAVTPGSTYAARPGQTTVTPRGDAGAPSVGGSDSTLSTADDVAIAGGAALLVAAAGFVAAQTRRRPAKPA